MYPGSLAGGMGNMTMRGSLPSFQAAQQTPAWQQPASLAGMLQMFPQLSQQMQPPPQLGNTAPNWLQHWPGALNGPTGGLNPGGTPTAPTTPQNPQAPQKPLSEEELAQFLSYYGGAGSGGGGM